MSKRFIKICPKCESGDVSPDLSVEALGKGAIFNQMKCNACGYIGHLFPEVSEKQTK